MKLTPIDLMNSFNLSGKKSPYVKVHSAAIHIEHLISLKQQQTWYFLLYRAYPEIVKDQGQVVFEVSAKDVKNAINFGNNDYKLFRDMIMSLQDVKVEWNILDKDRKDSWIGRAPLLSGVEYQKRTGLIRYTFDALFIRRFIRPTIYTKLNLLISRRFKSKHALNLYTMCLDYLNLKKDFSKISLSNDQLRKYLGLSPDQYVRPTDLHNRILKRAIKDINEESDIDVQVVPERKGTRKIVGFNFTFCIKPENIDFYRTGIALPPKSSDSNLESIFAKEGFNHDDASRARIKDICNRVGEAKAEKILHGVLRKYVDTKDKGGKVGLGLLRYFLEQDTIFVEDFDTDLIQKSAHFNKFVDQFIDVLLDECNMMFDSDKFNGFSQDLELNFDAFIPKIQDALERKPVLKKLFLSKKLNPVKPEFLSDKFLMQNLFGALEYASKGVSKSQFFETHKGLIFKESTKKLKKIPHLSSYIVNNKVDLKDLYEQVQSTVIEKIGLK